ncbi:MAG: 4-alpha-glucanotransferase [Acidimicrobiia bacterium]
MTRSSGVLLHPTSLPGQGGIGELGGAAHRFVEVLAGMRQSWWQMLPVGPTGFADSPYQSPSTFAGNPLLVDLVALADEGLLEADELAPLTGLPMDRVDYGEVIPIRRGLLDLAADRFLAERRRRRELGRFREAHGPVWLDEYALFAALKQAHDLREWTSWEPDLVSRQPEALDAARRELRTEIRRHEVIQFLFRRQWAELRRVCAAHGIRLIGDLPIFVAHDSAEVWANPHLFFLDGDGRPTVVAGVPPDYFSETGQRWGNPLYRWTRHRADGFTWWMARLRHVFSMFDLVRVDHFRGFAGYWEIPASEPTAVKGRWVKAPGRELFDACLAGFDDLPVIAEDLGVITEDVEELRDRYGFPGMKVLQFGFGFDSEHHPGAVRERVIVYTGTHDNDTTLGWFSDPAYAEEQAAALKFTDTDGSEFNWDLMRVAMGSVAETAIVPLQDVLGLGSEARMNTPGVPSGNWGWRFDWEQLTPDIAERFRALTEETGRAR